MENLECYRWYWLLLARMQLNVPKIEASDVVQQTLMEASAKREQFSGAAESLLRWLRMALANNIRDEMRKIRRQKRNVRREQSLEAVLDESSHRLELLARDESSPSSKAVVNEGMT